MLDSYIKFIQSHERLLIVFAVLIAGCFLGNKFMNYEIVKKDAALHSATAQVIQDQQDAKKQQDQVNADNDKFKQLYDKLQAQNQTLLLTIQQQSAILINNQQKNANAPLPDVAKRIATLANIQPTEVTATSDNVSLTNSGARSVANTLEEVPVLKIQVSDETLIAKNQLELLNQSQITNKSLTNQVEGLKIQNTDQQKQCQASVADIKARDRRSKRNWFLKGAAIGASVTLYIILHI